MNDEKTTISWRWAAVVSLLFILLVNALVIFRTASNFAPLPHNYLVSALQIYYSRPAGTPTGEETAYEPRTLDNTRFSPLYRLAVLFARLGRPSPAWFRLSGLVFVALLFITAYFVPRPPSTTGDRLIGALLVTTAPVVQHVGRLLDDHVCHLWFLLLGVLLLNRGGKRTRFVFFALPVADLLCDHNLTYWLLTCLGLAGMYGWWLIRRSGLLKEKKGLAVELAGWCASGALVVPLLVIRFGVDGGLWSAIRQVFGYYTGEMGGAEPRTWAIVFRELWTYPGTILLVTAGPLLCALALAQIVPSRRGATTGLAAASVLLPLCLLALVGKKEFFYTFPMTLGVPLLAAETAARLRRPWKALVIAYCLLSVLAPLTTREAPWKEWASATRFRHSQSDWAPEPGRYPDSFYAALAQRTLAALPACGDIAGRALLARRSAESQLDRDALWFALLSESRRPLYYTDASLAWLRFGERLIVVDYGRASAPSSGAEDLAIEASLPVAYRDAEIAVRCRPVP